MNDKYSVCTHIYSSLTTLCAWYTVWYTEGITSTCIIYMYNYVQWALRVNVQWIVDITSMWYKCMYISMMWTQPHPTCQSYYVHVDNTTSEHAQCSPVVQSMDSVLRLVGCVVVPPCMCKSLKFFLYWQMSWNVYRNSKING